MPGTWATLAAIPLVIAMKQGPVWLYIAITVGMILFGVYACGVTNRDFGTQDHPACAWDEMASFPLVMIGVPLTVYYLAAAVIVFRGLDILKPWPIGWIDRHVHGGLGVMLDDVVAALLSLLIMHVALWIL
jgi:phosphatidylglycerophosphatase A